MQRHHEIGKAVSVSESSYTALKTGRMTVIYRDCDEWNRRKFFFRPVKWLYVCRTNETTGECLKFHVKAISTTTLPSDSSGKVVIAIRLGNLAEIRNPTTGEHTFLFRPETSFS